METTKKERLERMLEEIKRLKLENYSGTQSLWNQLTATYSIKKMPQYAADIINRLNSFREKDSIKAQRFLREKSFTRAARIRSARKNPSRYLINTRLCLRYHCAMSVNLSAGRDILVRETPLRSLGKR